MFTKLKVVGLDHTITNPQLANEIVKISNEWKHSLRRWSKDHHDHCMQVACEYACGERLMSTCINARP